MQPKRILIVGNFGRKDLFRRYFNTEYKLSNGFICAGHHVVQFSDRDHAREATIWGTQKLGKSKMADKLIEIAKHYQPHLIFFGHVDLLDGACFERLKEALPQAKLATFCVDALFRKATMEKFSARAQHMHASFSTTADRDQLAQLGIPKGTLFFLPNPVDASIETARVFETRRQDLRLDGQFLGTGIEKRDEQISFIKNHLPSDYRFEAGGRAFDSQRIDSTLYLERLSDSAVSPNLPLNDQAPEQLAYLYSSDRIAQLLGQGVTTLCVAQSKLSDLYEDGIVEYPSREALVEQMLDLYKDDEKRMKIGKTGHRLAHERTSATTLADYILQATLGETIAKHAWNTAPV